MSLADPLTLNASPLAGLLACTTPFLFFTGKGGVGKTSIAAATAVALAEGGARVLIVSTDPASNLDEVLGVQAGTSPTPVPVPGVAGLTARNIDPDAAAAAYRERVVGPYRTLLPAGVVAKMEEELSGSCTVEIAAFNEFVALLADPTVAGDYDRIVFDTAPTGHTLRLLTLPGAWTGSHHSRPGHPARCRRLERGGTRRRRAVRPRCRRAASGDQRGARRHRPHR